MKQLLIVEDNEEYRKLFVREMEKEGFRIDETESPIKGLEYVALKKYDVVISDLNLPVMSGVLFTESVKNISPSTACIILTGDPDELSELESIENNIDLYIEKNKTISVISKYIHKLIKEYSVDQSKEMILTSRFEEIELNVNEHSVTKKGEHISLTPKEYELLKVFLLNKNNVLSREELIKKVWEEPIEDLDLRLVDNQIKKLRQKLKVTSLMTVRGYGYRWNEKE